ncbi:MAG TPA: hypothetical protein DCM64_12625 [Gammaproteobacteria bacterium]|jgi:hypothetical protein|nr:hypothetical protein [Gammaproteobacteria bacterium]
MRFLLFLMLSISASVFAMGNTGFGKIAFGVDQKKVEEEVFKMGLTPQKRNGNTVVVIPVYRLQELPVEVVFRFNRNGKFFSCELRTGKVEKNRFHKVIEAVRYLSERIQDQFGAPKKKNYFRTEEIKGKRFVPYWTWNNPELDVATFIRSAHARFYTQAVVTHKRLAREK